MKKANKKYYTNKNKNFYDDDISSQIKKFLIILGIIILSIALIWGFIILKNKLSENNVEETEVEIQYEEILAGQTFNRNNSEYYVIYATSDSPFYEIYKNYMMTSDKKIYIVDLNNQLNNKYISDEVNTQAQAVNELKVKDNTLIKIVDGKNTECVEGYENILNTIK